MFSIIFKIFLIIILNHHDKNLDGQDVVLEEVAKASVLMETCHQPELNLTIEYEYDDNDDDVDDFDDVDDVDDFDDVDDDDVVDDDNVNHVDDQHQHGDDKYNVVGHV